MFVWPKSRDNSPCIITEKMFAAERISPGGMLEKTVVFIGLVIVSVWEGRGVVELKHFMRQSSKTSFGAILSLFPVAHSILVRFFSVKKFSTARYELD